MLKISSLGSGSKGNCVLIDSGSTSIIIDAGFATRRIEKSLLELSVDPKKIAAILVTHQHSDHTKGVISLSNKYSIPVFAGRETMMALKREAGKDNTVFKSVEILGNDFFVGDITVSPFDVSHDVHCFGYSFLSGGNKITMCTDLGTISERTLKNISDSDIVYLESNHDEDTLKSNPHYPYYLKQRILSNHGHLSNRAAGEAAIKLIEGGTKQIMLAHLSAENNSPELAFETVRSILEEKGYQEGRHYKLHLALQSAISSVLEVL